MTKNLKQKNNCHYKVGMNEGVLTTVQNIKAINVIFPAHISVADGLSY